MNTLLTPEELARMLGLSVQTIYNRRHNGAHLPPALKLGNQIRYRQSDVERWLDARYEQPSVLMDAQETRRGRPTKAQLMKDRGRY